MPPKSASGRRPTRASARKSAPRVAASKSTVTSPSPSQETSGTLPPSAATATETLGSQDVKNHLDSSVSVPETNPPVTVNSAVEETVNNPISTNSSRVDEVEAVSAVETEAIKVEANHSITLNSTAEKENDPISTNSCGVHEEEAVSVAEAEETKMEASVKAGCSSPETSKPGAEAEISVALNSSPVQTVGPQSFDGTGKKKVVKKKVRIVKKVIKKRVPKRISNDDNRTIGNEISGKGEMTETVDVKSNDSKADASGIDCVKTTDEKTSVSNADAGGIGCAETETSVPRTLVDEREAEKLSPDDKKDAEIVPKGNGSVGEHKEENGNVDFAKDNNVGVVQRSENGEGKERFQGMAEKKVRLGERVALSGEMEALERKKRRRTEIFIGGLDKDVKEEDIRKVFEEVGEVVEVRLVLNGKTGKNKGYAFLRYASAEDAKKALVKYSKLELCGRQCGASPVEGNDTIFLGNINKKWKNEDVERLLKEAGIEKVDKVTVMVDPKNTENNRGFAFLELETTKDAQIAFSKLQKKDVFGKQKIKIAWAQPLIEPDEEEVLKVKSVYAEYLPLSWDEEKVKDYFGKFGEIENVVLARNLPSTRRKDFAFVNYTSREAALACIDVFSHEQVKNDGTEVKLKVSLAKPMPKGKQAKHVSNLTPNELPKEKRQATQSNVKLDKPRNKGKSTSSHYEVPKPAQKSTTTKELLELLREQASSAPSRRGPTDMNNYQFLPGSKRPFMGDDQHSLEGRGFPRARLESSYLVTSPRVLPQHVGVMPFPYHRHEGTSYASSSDSIYGIGGYQNPFQAREQAPRYGNSGLHRRY